MASNTPQSRKPTLQRTVLGCSDPCLTMLKCSLYCNRLNRHNYRIFSNIWS
jgi:uncharacterized protein (UPF0261 family)